MCLGSDERKQTQLQLQRRAGAEAEAKEAADELAAAAESGLQCEAVCLGLLRSERSDVLAPWASLQEAIG